MMKKLISAFAALAMLVSSFTAVFADETNTQTDYFEPSYAAEDWTVNGDKATFNATKKQILMQAQPPPVCRLHIIKMSA